LALGLVFHAGGFFARFLRGSGLQFEFAAELDNDGVADGAFLHSANFSRSGG
jgi:hypothetical protein